MPTLYVCGPHMAGLKRSCNAHGETWTVLSPGAPELAAFDKANAKHDREQHRKLCRRLGYA
ncbi:MAG: hypothetical protein LC808_24960 [Actinobacteria bacterium]|nr:hypothetical protein [Actinomycetota bacterium]